MGYDNLTELNKTKMEQAKQMFDDSNSADIPYHRNKNITEIAKPAIIAVTVLLGIFGVHDFMLGKNKEGVRHLLLISIMPVISLVSILTGNMTPEFSRVFNGPIMVVLLPLISMLASWIWGLIELFGYMQENSSNKKIIVEKQRYELDMENLKTILQIAAIASIATLIVEIITICLFIPYNCSGSYCWVNWLVALMMCCIGLEPFLVSTVFTPYWLILKIRTKKNGQLDPRLRKCFIASFGLFCGMLAGLIAVIIGMISS